MLISLDQHGYFCLCSKDKILLTKDDVLIILKTTPVYCDKINFLSCPN